MKTSLLFILSLAMTCLAKGPAPVRPAQSPTNAAPPSAIIESVAVDGKTLIARPAPGQSLAVSVPPRSQRLEIAYRTPNVAAPNEVRFRYRLEGLDVNWVDAGSTKMARYARLPAGRYRFEVVAADGDGAWSTTGSTVNITVDKVWSRSPAAALAALLLAVIG